MITKFRIEAEDEKKAVVLDQLTNQATRIISTIGQVTGEWECIDDACVGSPERGYKGRMVLKFHPDEEPDDDDGR